MLALPLYCEVKTRIETVLPLGRHVSHRIQILSQEERELVFGRVSLPLLFRS